MDLTPAFRSGSPALRHSHGSRAKDLGRATHATLIPKQVLLRLPMHFRAVQLDFLPGQSSRWGALDDGVCLRRGDREVSLRAVLLGRGSSTIAETYLFVCMRSLAQGKACEQRRNCWSIYRFDYENDATQPCECISPAISYSGSPRRIVSSRQAHFVSS
jgi:hypothetical protein